MDSDIGKKFGRLTVLRITGKDKNRHLIYECLCNCGEIKEILGANVRYGKTTSCGCYQKERIKNSRHTLRKETKERILKERQLYYTTIIGKKFGRLTIINISKDGKKEISECKCDCGKTMKTLLTNIINGHSKSCGCLRIYRHPERDVGLRKLYYRYKYRSKLYHKEQFKISLNKFKELTSKNCFYCGRPPETSSMSKSNYSNYVYNGLDRIVSSRGYTEDNVITACGICNKMKLNHSFEEFKNQIKKIYKHWVLNKKQSDLKESNLLDILVY